MFRIRTNGKKLFAYLAIGANLGFLLSLLLGGNGPVDDVQVDVGESQPLEGAVHGPLDILGTVQVVPDLGGDEEILSLDGGVLLEEVLDGLANLVFVQIVPGAIKMSVTGTEGVENGIVGFAFGALTGERTKAHTRNGDAVAQFESDSA